MFALKGSFSFDLSIDSLTVIPSLAAKKIYEEFDNNATSAR